MGKDIESRTREGIYWTAVFNAFNYALRIISSIIIARILFPEDFGLMGLATLTISFADLLANFGFGMALVQRKELEDDHLHTTFWINAVLMSSLTAGLFFAAGLMGEFFKDVRVVPVLQVISFQFVLRAFHGVPNALLIREMRFRQLGLVNTSRAMVAMLLPIPLALAGLGVWALVIPNLVADLVKSVAMTVQSRYVPRFRFRRRAMNDLFSFGIWAYINNYLNYLTDNIDYIVIGRVLDTAQLGFYERAFNLMSMPRKRLQRLANNVLLGTYSRMQDEDMRLVGALKRVIAHVAIVAYPLMIWMFIAAPSLITVLYGERWANTIVPLQVMCISGLLNTFVMIFHPLLMARNQLSGMAGRNVANLVLLAAGILIGVRWGINGVAWSVAISSVAYLALTLQIVMRNLPFRLRDFWGAQRSAAIYGAIMGVVLWGFHTLAVNWIDPRGPLMLGGLSVLAGLSFFGAHRIFRFDDVAAIVDKLGADLRKAGMKVFRKIRPGKRAVSE